MLERSDGGAVLRVCEGEQACELTAAAHRGGGEMVVFETALVRDRDRQQVFSEPPVAHFTWVPAFLLMKNLREFKAAPRPRLSGLRVCVSRFLAGQRWFCWRAFKRSLCSTLPIHCETWKTPGGQLTRPNLIVPEAICVRL